MAVSLVETWGEGRRQGALAGIDCSRAARHSMHPLQPHLTCPPCHTQKYQLAQPPSPLTMRASTLRDSWGAWSVR